MEVQEARVALVEDHMRRENAHDLAGCIGVFTHPRYEIVATGEVYDGPLGPTGVDGLLTENKQAFPDFHFAPTRTVPAGEAVLVEGVFTGTHLGTWRGLPATGRSVRVRMAVIFEFDGPQGTNLICERVYFDLGTVLRQLGVARDPLSLAGRLTTLMNHPLHIAGALLRSLVLRRRSSLPAVEKRA